MSRTHLVKIGPVELPLSCWARRILSVIVLVGLASAATAHIVKEWNPIISSALASEQVEAEVDSYNVHFGEPLEKELTAFDDGVRGVLVLGALSDGCTVRRRRLSTGGWTVKFIPDITHTRQPFAAPSVRHWSWPGMAVLTAAQQAPPCRGRCIRDVRDHRGEFRSWYGARDGDWVQVWRQWEDGCALWVWFHPVYGFRANQDGTPELHWVCCVGH